MEINYSEFLIHSGSDPELFSSFKLTSIVLFEDQCKHFGKQLVLELTSPHCLMVEWEMRPKGETQIDILLPF